MKRKSCGDGNLITVPVCFFAMRENISAISKKPIEDLNARFKISKFIEEVIF